MRQKFIYLTAILVCLCLAMPSAMAAERTTERNADRTERGTERGAADSSGTEETLRTPLGRAAKEYLGEQVQPLGVEGSSGTRSVASRSRVNVRPSLLVTRARILADAGETSRALATLHQVLNMGLESSPENDKALHEANLHLAELYAGSQLKQVYHLGAALQYAEPGARAELEGRIMDLGGDVFDATFNQGVSTATKAQVRQGDVCPGDPMVLPFPRQAIFPGVTAVGAHNWWYFDVTDPAGRVLHIETWVNANTAYPDTYLALFENCADDPNGWIFFGEDKTGSDWMSVIDTTCVMPGTYYLKVGGWLDIVAPGSYDLEVTDDVCPIDLPEDRYEPDDPELNNPMWGPATKIGHKLPDPMDGNSWGRVNRQTQTHAFSPARNVGGILQGDKDTVKFDIHNKTYMRLSSSLEHASFFNGFTETKLDPAGENCEYGGLPCDTVIELTYAEPKEWGGLCFDSGGYLGGPCYCPKGPFNLPPYGGQMCLSSASAAIRNAEVPPGPSYPYIGTPGGDACATLSTNPPTRSYPSCFCMQTNVSGDPFGCGPAGSSWPDCPKEVLISNDDKAADDLGSELFFCLPQTTGDTEPYVNGPWHVQVRPLGLQQFEYEVRVTPEAYCTNFETEPNDDLPIANPYNLGETINAWHAYSEIVEPDLIDQLGGEYDVYAFDPPVIGYMTLETLSAAPFVTDTFIALYLGPDPGGNYFYFGFANDDGGEGLLSRLALPPLPPANDIFGGMAPDAKYLLAVNSAFVQQDYPYQLTSTFTPLFAPETEPNDVVSGGTPMDVNPGDSISAEIGAGCDYDMFKVNLAEDAFVTFETSGYTDTTMQLVNCETGDLVHAGYCDDDSGMGTSSKIQGCLPAGDVCVRIRGFSAFTTGDYDFSARLESTGCVALDPPLVDADNAFNCAQPGAFETCP